MRKGKSTLIVTLVLLVFCILLVASTLSGSLYFILFRTGVLPAWGPHWFPLPILVLFIVAIIIGTLLTIFVGNLSLRPVHKLIDATEEIAAGNFDVRVDIGGPQELHRLARSFNTMAKALGSIDTLRNDFVSSVSHEFKTPVASIKGFAKLLKKDTLDPESRKEYLDIIIRESERLAKLSGNVLLLSKLESQSETDKHAPFSLDEQIRRCVLLLAPDWGQKQLEISVDLPPITYLGNAELLQQVWMNLLENAIKFSPPQGEVRVLMVSSEDAIIVEIADTGIGMNAETLHHLFDKFYQGDRSRATEGNGLGLSLTKRIVERSGGDIHVQSVPGKGSTFSVRLPRKRQPPDGALE